MRRRVEAEAGRRVSGLEASSRQHRVMMALPCGSVGTFAKGHGMHAPPPLPLRERAGERGALFMREAWPQHRSGGQSLRELSTLRLDRASSWPRRIGVARSRPRPLLQGPGSASVGAVLTAIGGSTERRTNPTPPRRLQQVAIRLGFCGAALAATGGTGRPVSHHLAAALVARPHACRIGSPRSRLSS